MSNFEKENSSYSNKAETVSQNKSKNRNTRNDALTKFFSNILECQWFQRILLFLLSIIALFLTSILILVIIFVFQSDSLDVTLEVLYKLGVPFIAIFIFFIKFGDNKYLK